MQMEFDLAETSEREPAETTRVQSDLSSSPASADEGVPWLEMDPTEFRAALKHVLKLARSKERAEAVISFADGQVAIAFPGLEVRSAAEGVWPGEARVSAGFIQGLARRLAATRAESGPWKFHVEGETLFFGTRPGHEIARTWLNSRSHVHDSGDLGCEYKVVRGQPPHGVGPYVDTHTPPCKAYVGMMIYFIGNDADAIHKRQSR